jgi:plasmid stability protein
MASIVINNVNESVKALLQAAAARHGRTEEEEARNILICRLAEEEASGADLAERIAARFRPFGGVDLPEIPRDPMREPPGVDE